MTGEPAARWPARSYRSEPPYFVTYEWKAHTETWNLPDLAEALRCFWQDGHLSPPGRRSVIDLQGQIVMEEINHHPPRYRFFITDEAHETFFKHIAEHFGSEHASLRVKDMALVLATSGEERHDGTRW